jgi:glutamate racemase
MAAAKPIGVFDSGMGGLTVLRALRKVLPGESYVYLGDTARLPYGTKSPETVTRYALQAAQALIAENVKLLVVACNTASAVALPALAETFAPLPVVGVIEPGAEAGVKATRNRHVAVIATESTVRGGAYPRVIGKLAPDIRVSQQACPLFVALAEEGWQEGEVALATARRYLEPLFAEASAPDTLILGCTHFPVLRGVVEEVCGPKVRIVDSAETTAARVASLLDASSGTSKKSAVRFFVTDGPERFARVGALFLGESLSDERVALVDLPPLCKSSDR